MSVNVAINGFGRIGRMVFRRAFENEELKVCAINTSHPIETIAHLIKYDSIHGKFEKPIRILDEAHLLVDGRSVTLVNSRDPRELPWKSLNIDIVIEATGKFKTKETAGWHLEAGAKKVIITAPAKDEDLTIVVGVNDALYDGNRHHILSNASCTTNCLAPIAKMIDEAFGIQSGMMTTVHSYTNDQNNIDNPHKDLRRARACTESIIPTSTGAALAISKVLPHLQGKLNGLALRVPTPNVSLVDLVLDIQTPVTTEHLNKVMKEMAENEYKGIVKYSDEPLVSVDYRTDPHSAIIDGLSTMVLGQTKIKVLAWYDNEWGYSSRVVDLANLIARSMKKQKDVKAS